MAKPTGNLVQAEDPDRTTGALGRPTEHSTETCRKQPWIARKSPEIASICFTGATCRNLRPQLRRRRPVLLSPAHRQRPTDRVLTQASHLRVSTSQSRSTLSQLLNFSPDLSASHFLFPGLSLLQSATLPDPPELHLPVMPTPIHRNHATGWPLVLTHGYGSGSDGHGTIGSLQLMDPLDPFFSISLFVFLSLSSHLSFTLNLSFLHKLSREEEKNNEEGTSYMKGRRNSSVIERCSIF
jgi:hypothetical protein